MSFNANLPNTTRSGIVSLRNKQNRGRNGTRLYCFIIIVSLCAAAVFLLFVHLEDSIALSAKPRFIRGISPYLHVPLDLISSSFPPANETSSTEEIEINHPPVEHVSQYIEDRETVVDTKVVQEVEKLADDTVATEFYGQAILNRNESRDNKGKII